MRIVAFARASDGILTEALTLTVLRDGRPRPLYRISQRPFCEPS
jgi:hypothetical protein